MTGLINIKPRLSEKSYALSEQRNTYVFEVPAASNRHEVARAISKQYEVTVESVRIASQPSKTRRDYRRRGRVIHSGRSSALRKAYVRLKEGDKLPIFEATKEDKQAKESKRSK